MAHIPPHKDKKLVVPLLVGGALVVGAFFLLNEQKKNAAPSSRPQGSRGSGYSESFLANLANLQSGIDEAAIGASSQRATAYYSYATAANQDAADVKRAQLQYASADFLGQLQAKIAAIYQQIAANTVAGQEQIASTEAGAITSVAQQQASAQQSAGIFGIIGNFFSSIFSAIGLGGIFGGGAAAAGAGAAAAGAGAGAASFAPIVLA